MIRCCTVWRVRNQVSRCPPFCRQKTKIRRKVMIFQIIFTNFYKYFFPFQLVSVDQRTSLAVKREVKRNMNSQRSIKNKIFTNLEKIRENEINTFQREHRNFVPPPI